MCTSGFTTERIIAALGDARRAMVSPRHGPEAGGWRPGMNLTGPADSSFGMVSQQSELNT